MPFVFNFKNYCIITAFLTCAICFVLICYFMLKRQKKKNGLKLKSKVKMLNESVLKQKQKSQYEKENPLSQKYLFDSYMFGISKFMGF